MNEKEEPKGKNKIKAFFRIAAWSIGVLIFLVISFALFLQTKSGGNLILARAEKILEEKTGLSLRASRLSLNVFRLKATLDDLEIASSGKSSVPVEAFSCQKIFVRTSISTLAGGDIHFKQIEIIRPVISLKPGKSQAEPFQKKEKSGDKVRPTQVKAFNLQIDALALRNGSLSFKDLETPISIHVSDLRIDINFHPEANLHRVELQTGKGSVAMAAGKVDLIGLGFVAVFDTEKIKVEKFSLQATDSTFDLAGTVENYLHVPKIALQADGKINLEEASRLIDFPGKNSGDVGFEIKAEGEVRHPEISGIISGDNLTLSGISPINLKVKVTRRADDKYLTQARLKVGRGDLILEGELPADLKGAFKSRLSLDNLDLSLLSSFFPELPVVLDSRASGQVGIEGQEFSFKKARAKAEIKLRPTGTRVICSPKPVIPVFSDVRATYFDGRAEVEKLTLSLYHAEVGLSGKIEPEKKVSGRLILRVPDLSATRNELALAELEKIFPGLSSRIQELERLKGGFNLEGTLSGKLDNPALLLSFNGKDISYRDVTLKSLEMQAGGNLAQINLEKFRAVFDQGLIEGSGKLARVDRTKSSVYGLEAKLQFSRINLKQFSGLVPEESRDYLNGFFSGWIRVSGTSASPETEFDLGLTGAEVGSLQVDSLELVGDFKKGTIRVEKLKLVQPEGQLSGNFIFNQDTGELHAELSGQAIKLASFRSWLPGIQAGQIDFNCKTSGPWEKPVLDLTLTGQGFLFNNIWLPYLELKVHSDGEKGSVHFEVPRFNLSLEAGVDLKSPYWLKGQILVSELPLSSLAGILPDVKEVSPEVALNGSIDISLPLEKPEELQAEFKFENFDFEGLAALVPSLKPMNPGGRADGRIKLTGFSSDLSKMELVAEIPHLNLKLNELKIKNDAPLSLVLRDGRLEVKNFTLLAGKSLFKLSGLSLVKDISKPGLDFSLKGELDLADFNPWLTAMSAGGRVFLNANIKGDLNNPLVEGDCSVRDVFFRLQDLPVVVSNINGLIKVDNSRLKLEEIRGLANSGSFSGSGEAVFGEAFSLQSARVNFDLHDFDFNYPQGFTSLSAARLTLSKDKRTWLLSGNVSLLSANYREDFYPSTQGLKLAFTRVSPVGTEMPAFLYDMALDVNVRTIENIIIKNNLADLEIRANLNIKGTIPAPILTGRVENAYPGEIIVGERKYTAERLRVDFLGRENLEPNMDIALNTTVVDQEEEVEVNLNLSGTPSDLKFSLTSNPTRTQEDLASLLLTGKSLRDVQGSAINTITGQLIQHFSSPLASPVTKTLKKWLKAEDVVLEPLNIATLQDPGARLTIRKRMAKEVAVTYSIDLTNSQYQTWILDYSLKRNFSLRGFRKDDGVLGLNLRHKFSVGKNQAVSGLSPVARFRRKLDQVEIEGETIFPADQIKKKLKLKTGKDFRSSELQKGLNRLYSWYRKNGYASAQINARTEDTAENKVAVFVNIQPNKLVDFRFSGDKIPGKARKKALSSWVSRLPEEANLNQFQYILLQELNKRGYYRAEVNIKKITEGGRIVFLIDIKKNDKWKIRDFSVEGDPVFKESLITRIVSNYFGAKSKGLWNLVYDQKIALELVQYFYQENGYLQAKIEKPVIEESPERRQIRLRLKIEAGPQSRVQSVGIEGNRSIITEELRSVLSLKQGEIFSWPALTEDRTALVNRFRSAGFKDVRVEAQAQPVNNSPDYEVFFSIDEGEAYRISGVEISGTRRTRSSFILKETDLKPGETVSLERLAQAQKNLYDSGVFQEVRVSSVPEQLEGHREKVTINVREIPWLTLTYGLQYNTETKFEGFTQFDFNNLLGQGWNSLIYLRANQRQQEGRFSIKIPYIFSRKTDSLLSFYYLKNTGDVYITEQLGTSFQQKIMIVRGFDLSWVYRLSRIHDYEKESSGPFPYDVRVLTSEISVLLNRDTRDDKFDPHHGSLLVSHLSYSPKFLGSDLNFITSFTQFTMYKTVLRQAIWASCFRLGLASAFGQELIPSRRFFAGGGTSIRGFKLDSVGPLDPWVDLPEGGEAMVVVNQELRFPIYKIFRGVAFFDFGNVYSKLKDINLTDLRTGAGLGLRIDSPLGLIRFDYGVNLKPRPGEPKSTIFFSIGQAF
jgi:outer membrane protein assembly complex protein YaeT